MENVTFIIPIHVYNKTVEPFIKRAFESLKNAKDIDKCKTIIIGTATAVKKAESLYTLVGCPQELTTIVNTETEFCTQINKASLACLTKYFTVLEFDDAIYPYWGTIMDRYTKAEKGVSAYLPIAELVKAEVKNDTVTTTILAYINEIAWATAFANEPGYLDKDCLETYMDFFADGGLIKTEDFIAVGGLKPSLKLAAWYEFMLRLCHKEKRIFIIPRIGSQHTVGRDGSYMVDTQKNISQAEGQWLIKTAKQEYFFKEDRNKKFSDVDAVSE